MPYRYYDRLTAVDTMFLEIEDQNVHMHVAAIALFETGPLANPDGTLAIDRIRTLIEGALEYSVRFKQKLTYVPVTGDPVWVDDHRFMLDYHVRHTSLPRPGSVRMLKRLAGRILSQKLDRAKPLWEMWIIEGVENDQFAIIAKAHHCMVDGISGLDILSHMLRPDRNEQVDPPARWYPRPLPSPRELLAGELKRRLSLPLSALEQAPEFLRHPVEVVDEVRETVTAVSETLSAGFKPTMSTPLNDEIGPNRRFDWTETSIKRIREIRGRLGGTLNDVVLATAAGAIGSFLRQRGMRTDNGIFRAQVPVSVRRESERTVAGNRVAMLMAELPIDETDPTERLRIVTDTTTELKASRQRAGVEFLERAGERAGSSLWLWFARLATWQRSFNTVVTNVPGPQMPMYLLGARMKAIYPVVPLAYNQGLGIALFSYDGKLFWGLHADWDALPDLHDLSSFIDQEFEALHAAAEPPTLQIVSQA